MGFAHGGESFNYKGKDEVNLSVSLMRLMKISFHFTNENNSRQKYNA